MALRLRLSGALPGRAWVLVALLVAVPALPGWAERGAALEHLSWQPARAWGEPWRWWSAAWVHLSLQHLVANGVGAVLVAAFGWAAALPRQAAWAWLLAWPLTHLGLLLQPGLARYGGASGVLHAGVAVTATFLLLQSPARQRMLGAAVLGGLGAKVWLEAPWQGPLIHPPGWDIAVAPLAHAAGAASGVACALALWALAGRSRGPLQNV